MKWSGLLVKDLISIQVSNFTSDHGCGQQWYVNEIFPMPSHLALGTYLNLPRVPRLSDLPSYLSYILG